MTTIKATFLAALAALCTAAAAIAAPSVRVEPQNAAVYVGQSLTLRYTTTGVDQQPAAPSLTVPGCDVRYAGASQSSQVRIINGRRTSSFDFTFSYAVTPRSPGSYAVEPLTFTLDSGETIQAQGAKFAAVKAPASDDFQIDIEAEAREVYVGQPVRITWTWRLAKNIAGAEIDWPAPDGAEVLVAPESDPDRRGRVTTIPLMGVSAALSEDRRSDADQVWSVYEAELIIIPERPGELTIPACSILVEADTGRRRRGVSVFDTRTVTETVSCESEPLALSVSTLPAPGRPDNFTGLVGEFELEAAATPTSVRVGDPISFRVALESSGPMTAAPTLPIASDPRFTADFRVDGDSEPERTRSGVVIERTLRARRDDVAAIPPVELAYFDPAEGRYRVARTAPIPLEVAPTRVVTLADAQGETATTQSGQTLESRAGGLAANATSPSALQPERFSLVALATQPATLTLLAAPPALFAAAGVLAIARTRAEKNAPNAERRRALTDARRTLRYADSPDAVASSLRAALAQLLADAPASITPAEARRAIPSDAGETIASVLETCDAARFGGSTADPSELADRADRALDELHKETRR